MMSQEKTPWIDPKESLQLKSYKSAGFIFDQW